MKKEKKNHVTTEPANWLDELPVSVDVIGRWRTDFLFCFISKVQNMNGSKLLE